MPSEQTFLELALSEFLHASVSISHDVYDNTDWIRIEQDEGIWHIKAIGRVTPQLVERYRGNRGEFFEAILHGIRGLRKPPTGPEVCCRQTFDQCVPPPRAGEQPCVYGPISV